MANYQALASTDLKGQISNCPNSLFSGKKKLVMGDSTKYKNSPKQTFH